MSSSVDMLCPVLCLHDSITVSFVTSLSHLCIRSCTCIAIGASFTLFTAIYLSDALCLLVFVSQVHMCRYFDVLKASFPSMTQINNT